MTNKQQLREEKLIEIAEAYSHYSEPDKKTIQAMREYASYVLQEEMEGLRKEIKELPEKLGVQPMQIGWWDEVLENVLSLIPKERE